MLLFKENAVPLDTVLWLLPDQLHFPGLMYIFHLGRMSDTHCSELQLEAKIYSRTDIISDRRLQRSKHGSNVLSSEQQDMLALG